MRKVSRFVFVFLIASLRASRDPFVGINELVTQIDQVQNFCVAGNVLDRIKTNLIFNLRYHDTINFRELQNIYKCYLGEYQEVMGHLNCAPLFNEYVSFETIKVEVPRPNCEIQKVQLELAKVLWKRKALRFDSRDKLAVKVISWQIKRGLKDLSQLNMAVLQLEDLWMIVNGEAPLHFSGKIASILTHQNDINKIRFGEFFKAADTFAHFIQTRLQHTAKHARSLAQISTDLLRVVSAREPNVLGCLTATVNAVHKLALLSQKELVAHPETAHIELFIGGFNNILITLPDLSKKPEESQLEFTLNALVHTIESIFPGTVLVKQALAIEALYLRQNLKKLNYTINFGCLQNLQTFSYVQTNEMIEEIVVRLRQAAFAIKSDDFHYILQLMSVRVLNIYRMSHENNLQILFLHLCSALSCIGVDHEDDVQNLVIDAYDSTAASEATVAVLQKMLEDVQAVCMKRVL